MGYQPCGDIYNELLNKFKNVEPNATKVTVVRKINCMRSAFHTVEKVGVSKRSGASTDYVYEPSLWYFNELLFLVDQDTPGQSSYTLHEENDGMTEEFTVYLLRVWVTETH
jgi:hypothetical protein